MTFTIYDNDLAPATAEEFVSDTALAFLPTSAVPVDKLAIIPVVWDNVDGTNADDTTKLSVADTKGNSWIRAGEAQYSAGTFWDGVLVGVFYSVITTQIETTDTVTITSTANGQAKGATMCAFNRDTAKTIGVAGKGYQRSAGASSYSVTVSGLTNEEHLWIGTNGMELDRANVNDFDTDFLQIFQGTGAAWGVTGGTSTEDVGARGAYKISTSTTETYDHASLATADRCTVLVAFNEVTAGGGAAQFDPFGMSGFFGA